VSELGELAALAVVCANFQNLRPSPPIGDVLTIAEDCLHKLSAERHEETALPNPTTTVPAMDKFTKQIEEHLGGSRLPEAAEQIKQAFQTLAKALTDTQTAHVKNVQALERQIRLQAEETQFLWWLFTASSRDLNEPFSRMSCPALCLIIGKELADLTRLSPGPATLPAFMSKVLTQAQITVLDNITIPEAVNAVPDAWLKRIGDDTTRDILDICPVHLAIDRAVEIGAVSWPEAYSKATGVATDAALAPVQVSFQFYRERLLLRAYQEAE
jgi:hypothetical protein